MIVPNAFIHYFDYFVKRDVDKFFVAIAIRNLAIGMVFIFEPIYLYLFFNKALYPVFLYFAVLYGLYAVFAVLGAKFISRFGPSKSILVSYFLYFGYYVSLFLFPTSPLFVLVAVLMGSLGMALFWPSFHIDFVRFSSARQRGNDVGRINVAALLPTVISPFIGGWILMTFGYPVLFVAVLLVLLASAIPLAYTRETHEVYTDSYKKVWTKICSRERWRTTVAFASNSLEIAIDLYIWPLFMFILAISFSEMGGITSIALFASALFMLYMGRLSDTPERPWLLNVGALWTSIAWIIKYFVRTPFDAFLAQIIYKTSRAASGVPFFTFFYERAGNMKGQADEFIVYREVINGIVRFVFFALLSIMFLFFPGFPLGAIFFVGAVSALGFMFLQNQSKLKA